MKDITSRKAAKPKRSKVKETDLQFEDRDPGRIPSLPRQKIPIAQKIAPNPKKYSPIYRQSAEDTAILMAQKSKAGLLSQLI